ncbi:hypothetical protein J437_LFUL001228 [Ladona fulva]|uniref:Methylated-DNA--protein-cysteine methyltransferase n=1 Tax=Ladona fulva TaxID=123851 RepID=A0A8K0JWY8_LADFU|nr:hypothetical protein J437_LFUL001228 [Ladona fulva]
MPTICPTLKTEKFQEKTWQTLAKNIAAGEVVTYKRLAEMVNSPGAARAVGSAMAANPFQIIVPCHRVLPSSGKLGNYAHGKKNKVKAWLLAHEGIHIS